MRVTKRELSLLTLLIAFLIIGGYYYFIIDDRVAEVEGLSIEVAEKEKELQDAIKINELEENFIIQYDVIKDEVKDRTSKMLVNIEQEDIILLMNEFFGKLRDQVSVINYNIGQSISAGNLENNIFSMSINFSGEYSELMELLNRFWDYNKYVSIGNISISSGEDDIVSANMSVSLYNLHLTNEERDRLILWMLNDIEGTRNPFDEIYYPIDTSDYLYLGDPITGVDEFIFKRFGDIDGHWAENEINTFNQLNYVYGMDKEVFEPESPITKSQFVVMIDRILKWPLPAIALDLSSYEGFEDLRGFEYEYKKALYKGYITYENINSLGPNEYLTREQVVDIINNTINEEFQWNNLVDIMIGNNIDTTDYVEGLDQIVTRAEAVYLLYYFR